MGIHEENAQLLKELKEGDLVEFKHSPASHWGVYVGGGMIVHVTGDPADLIGEAHLGDIFTVGGQSYPKARVRKTDFHEAAAGRKAIRNNSKDEDERFEVRSLDEIIQRAESWIMYTMPYHKRTNSCQRFAEYCCYHDTEADEDVIITADGCMDTVPVFQEMPLHWRCDLYGIDDETFASAKFGASYSLSERGPMPLALAETFLEILKGSNPPKK